MRIFVTLEGIPTERISEPMKGLVFTEFFNLVESTFDEDMVDLLIDNTKPSSKGAYTSVGSYDYAELEAMVVELHKQSEIPVSDLLTLFGKHLGEQFALKFSSFFEEAGSTVELLKTVDEHIHVEVRKLYPDAQLPKFSYETDKDDGHFILNYESVRPLAEVAYGLILKTSEYYKETFNVAMEKWTKGAVYHCKFDIYPH